MSNERFVCPFSTRVGDDGQRFEVWCMDGEGGSMKVGWSDQPDGGSLAKMIHAHPMWHSPWIVDRGETPLTARKLRHAAPISPDLAESEDHGDVSTHILERVKA